MIDNEIVKALECHASDAEFCKLCPLTNEEWCSVKLARNTLDLINYQQAEIERLSKKNEELAEILSDTIRIRYAEAKAEAIKEFAERLQQRTRPTLEYCEVVLGSDIDNLVKEMVGDTE